MWTDDPTGQNRTPEKSPPPATDAAAVAAVGTCAPAPPAPASGGPNVVQTAPAWQGPFLEAAFAAVATCPRLRAARWGVARSYAYERKRSDRTFAAAWHDAKEEALDRIEEALYERAVDGVDEPVFFAGQCVGTKKAFDTTAAIFLLKGGRPETYRERHQLQHSGPEGGAMPYGHLPATPEEIARDLAPYAEALGLLGARREGAVSAPEGGAATAGRAHAAAALGTPVTPVVQ